VEFFFFPKVYPYYGKGTLEMYAYSILQVLHLQSTADTSRTQFQGNETILHIGQLRRVYESRFTCSLVTQGMGHEIDDIVQFTMANT
jgi:hypothetical protein